ncbi:leucine-rich repeat-containing protein 53 [Anguilla anguilla]|uniref:leucine-rich repeat-containing protein 53 n=1 Tax=Anguilla anguilla TaxID=7936 RepID=UPI0015A8E9BC|nr:leucine-rich repeat-containing protein 53 [Anguilla anguilla]
MRGFLLVMLMSFTYVRHITSCPASCVVCSEDAIICHKLSNIIGVPETTKVLMLTDGQIDSVGNGNFSDLSNMTMLGLSNNAIANITESAFRNLTVLRVLLLDHNLITSASIFSSTFSQLWSLEILQLGNNAIRVIDGGWFRDLGTLLTLQLEGNLITSLGSATFRSDLENLETLDLSDNLIEHVGRGSFRALPRLRRLDLSRNSLRTAPDAFSYLSWLSALNLDHNRWNCTCELQELSAFLSSYMQAPDKVLYNGRQLVCLSAANPAVHTVLQLTEANCVPPNENITVVIAAKGGISARQYARDVSLAALFFFAGKVLLLALLTLQDDEQHILEGGLGQEELKPLSNQGSTDMLPNQESEGKIMDTLTVEEEPKKENAPLLDTLQGDNSDGAMVTDVPVK